MQEFQHAKKLTIAIKALKQQSKSIAFVPTMGNLHAGHLSLLKKARELCDIVVVSIFVNPLQFGINEDFGQYPRTLEDDLKQLKLQQCDIVFLPNQHSLLPVENSTQIIVSDIGESLEETIRVGHLSGVATIVTKLFNIIQPDIACFGKKDYQQWLMIKKMVSDLNIDTDIVGCETVREEDGLALSSRNQYLNPEHRAIAPALRQTLIKCAKDIKAGHQNMAISDAIQTLEKLSF